MQKILPRIPRSNQNFLSFLDWRRSGEFCLRNKRGSKRGSGQMPCQLLEFFDQGWAPYIDDGLTLVLAIFYPSPGYHVTHEFYSLYWMKTWKDLNTCWISWSSSLWLLGRCNGSLHLGSWRIFRIYKPKDFSLCNLKRKHSLAFDR